MYSDDEKHIQCYTILLQTKDLVIGLAKPNNELNHRNGPLLSIVGGDTCSPTHLETRGHQMELNKMQFLTFLIDTQSRPDVIFSNISRSIIVIVLCFNS